MLTFLIIYILILLLIGIYDSRKIKNAGDFIAAGKNQTLPVITMSLLATMLGASATLGVMEKISDIGFAAFWWLAVGTIGLFFQAFFLSEKIRRLNADTLPDLIEKMSGRTAAVIAAIIIIVAWPGIIASQIVAMTSILAVMTGQRSNNSLMLIVALILILYSAIGGQLSVIRTDVLQFIIILAAFVSTFIYLFFFSDGNISDVLSDIHFFNKSFGLGELINWIFIVGGTYMLGPDIISRNLASKDARTAKKSAISAGIILLIFNLLIILIGMFITKNTAAGSENPLLYIIKHVLPKPIGTLLTLGLLSTLLSSADTCLVNIASIIEADILKRKKIGELRCLTFLIGCFSLFLAFSSKDIITMLQGAYSIYAPGLVCPLFVAIITHDNAKSHLPSAKPYYPLWIMAILSGGVCGFIHTYIFNDLKQLPIIGFSLSLILSCASISPFWTKIQKRKDDTP